MEAMKMNLAMMKGNQKSKEYWFNQLDRITFNK